MYNIYNIQQKNTTNIIKLTLFLEIISLFLFTFLYRSPVSLVSSDPPNKMANQRTPLRGSVGRPPPGRRPVVARFGRPSDSKAARSSRASENSPSSMPVEGAGARRSRGHSPVSSTCVPQRWKISPRRWGGTWLDDMAGPHAIHRSLKTKSWGLVPSWMDH